LVLLKKQMRIYVMPWKLNQERESTQILGYLNQDAHTTCSKKENGSAYTNLSMEAQS